jgi:hypothetical protein
MIGETRTERTTGDDAQRVEQTWTLTSEVDVTEDELTKIAIKDVLVKRGDTDDPEAAADAVMVVLSKKKAVKR